MAGTIRIALAQINTVVGDLKGNAEKIAGRTERARQAGAQLVAFPELALCGYPPEDLLLKPKFIEDMKATLASLLPASEGIIAIVGHAQMTDDLYNTAAVLYNGKLIANYHKIFLPNYGVFDEQRYFQRGTEIPVFRADGLTFGVNICEDIWFAEGPTNEQALEPGCQLVVNISSSPYYCQKGLLREKMVGMRAYDNQVYIAYVNTVGGQDELVFDGQSLVAGPDGTIIARGRQFAEDLVLVDLDLSLVSSKHLFDPKRRQRMRRIGADPVAEYAIDDFEVAPVQEVAGAMIEPKLAPVAEIYEALKTGLHDYVRKNGFETVVIGISGGIDSALTAAICADALGPDNVVGVAMPSRYSSKESVEDAEALARNLGFRLLNISIEPAFAAMKASLAEAFDGLPEDITEENMQPRTRGMILMALSNKFNWLVIATGNKSEIAVGYTTLYGDMVGGFAVIKDVLKTTVYELSEYRNSLEARPVIPGRVITKEPSAELKPNQKDVDTLPPYPILDTILKGYVESEKSMADLIAEGLPADYVRWVILKVDQNEYKRRQGPIGIKISRRAFGKDRRMPITNAYRERP
ncbi:MAG TPA: NAD+ synthase [Candidatus Aquicultor sp.]|jgi:NAD+ synthase (glutamine-hydrolysing)